MTSKMGVTDKQQEILSNLQQFLAVGNDKATAGVQKYMNIINTLIEKIKAGFRLKFEKQSAKKKSDM